MNEDACRFVLIYSGIDQEIRAATIRMEWARAFDLVADAFDCKVCKR